MRAFRQLVWIGAVIYLAALIPALIFALPRMAARPTFGIAIKNRAVTAADPSTQLHSGDRVLSLNGDPRIRPHWFRAEGNLRLEVDGAAGRRTVTLPVRAAPAPLLAWVVGLHLAISAAFFTLGIVLAWKRPELRTARIGWFASMVCALAFLDLTLNMMWAQDWAIPTSLATLAVVLPWHKVAGYWFFTFFPSEKPQTRPWRILTILVLATAPLYWLLTIPYNLNGVLSGGQRWWIGSLPEAFLQAGIMAERVMSPLLSLATCAILIRAYRISNADERRRILWVVAATCVTLVTAAAALFADQMGWSPANLYRFANSTVLLIPLSLGYAITKHQVFGIRVVVRRSFQYLLARGVLETAIVFPVVAMVAIGAFRPQVRIDDLIHPAYTVFVVLAVPGILFRRQILRAVDRRFFRPAWDEEQLLSGLVESIQSQVDFHETEATVSRYIRQALHPETLTILYREERGGAALSGGIAPPEYTALWDRLVAGRSLVVSLAVRNLASEDEKAWLERTGAAVIVPIPGAVRFRGLLILGPKKSEEPYTSVERKLLQRIAAQMAVAHENYWLSNERISAVVAERNRMARELHDGFAQGFAGINLHLQSAAKAIEDSPATALRHVEQARQLARSSMAEARRSVHELRSAAQTPNNLVSMLRELAARLSAECVIEVEALALPNLPDEVSRNLFRIAQESITNALKHAGATRILVSISAAGSRVEVRVRDNGCGFDSAKSPSGGYGLIGMRERAFLIHGQVEIRSRVGEGTEVVALVECP